MLGRVFVWTYTGRESSISGVDSCDARRANVYNCSSSMQITRTPSDSLVLARSRVRRWLLALVGVVCVMLGGIGVVVPGMPTTVFLIVASWCFVRSCPWLEDKLLKNRLFAPYLKYLGGSAVMPMKARVMAIAMMWLAIGVSLSLLSFTGVLSAWLMVVIPAVGLIGTAAILFFRRV